MDQLVENKFFKDGISAAKYVMAIAINAGVKPKSAEGVGTVWNVGSFDVDGELKNLIPILYPGTTAPYRVVEDLINTGFKLLGKELKKNPNFQPTDVLVG
jgi:hypothetical protein